jgi:outer membrane protein TolC
LLAVAEARYATGKVGQQDVFQAQVQLTRMVEALVALRGQRGATAARLNRLLYRPAESAVPKLPALSLTPASSEEVSAESLLGGNSRLGELAARREQAGQRAALAEQWRRPDWTATVGYMVRAPMEEMPMSGKDMWSASVGIELPWINRRRHEEELAAAQAQKRAAEQGIAAELNAVLARVEELSIELGRTEDQLSLVETGLLPQAEGALAASRAAYATGMTESVSVLGNQLNLYNLQLQRAQLLREHEQGLAELEYEIRGALGGANMAAGGPPPEMPAMAGPAAAGTKTGAGSAH